MLSVHNKGKLRAPLSLNTTIVFRCTKIIDSIHEFKKLERVEKIAVKLKFYFKTLLGTFYFNIFLVITYYFVPKFILETIFIKTLIEKVEINCKKTLSAKEKLLGGILPIYKKIV